MKNIEKRFNDVFSSWDIRLPEKDVTNRRRGKIFEAGWTIWYLFGSDERGEYLDYYASHRVTTDQHTRIYANGNEEDLPVIESMRVIPKRRKGRIGRTTEGSKLLRKVVRKTTLEEQPTDFAYWRRQPYEARLAALEEIRGEYHQWRYDTQPRLQRFLRIVKRG